MSAPISGYPYENPYSLYFGRRISFIQKRAEQGDAEAQFQLGMLYQTGRGVKQSYVEACNWLWKAVDQKHPGAMAHLGWNYHLGQGVPKSDETALSLIEESASLGDSYGMQSLGEAYMHGYGVPQSDEKAIYWLKKCVDHGGSCEHLARLFLEDYSFKYDIESEYLPEDPDDDSYN